MAHASGRGGAVTAGDPLATADALATALATALAEGGGPPADAGGYEICALGTTVVVGVAGTTVAVAVVGAVDAKGGLLLVVTAVGAGVLAGPAQAIATNAKASNETDLRCLMAILLLDRGG
jgi:hypothetical protein